MEILDRTLSTKEASREYVVNELVSKLNSLLLADISKHLSKLIPNEAGWIDAVDRRIAGATASTRSAFRALSGKTRSDHVYSRLGHIVVNPHNAFNTDALVSSYVFGDSSGQSREKWINSSEQTAQVFVDELIAVAHNQRDFLYSDLVDPTGQALSAQNVIIIHGPRGCGKTFFLNFLLSKFSHHFDDKRVIWVRLNLVENFGDKINLQHWIYAQTTKIILRYYDPGSSLYDVTAPKPIPLNATKHLREFIAKTEMKTKTRKSLEMKLIGMKQVFHSMKRDEALSPDLIPEILAREVTSYAQECGYGLIIVLDGLDRLESIPLAQEKFSNLIFQASSVTHSSNRSGMTFLMVCRTATLDYLEGPNYDPFKNRKSLEHQLMSVPLKEIIERRISYVKKEVSGIGVSRNWDLSDWDQHLHEFVKYLEIDDLEKTFGSNKRAQVQTIQLNYHQFLSESGKKAYLLTETLMKMGHRWPPKQYVYRAGENNKWTRALRGVKKFV